MVTLHQFEISPFCDKLRRLMNYKGIDYRVVEYPLLSSRRIKQLNPVGKLPVLEHQGRFIADSTDIARYLEQTFPEHPLIPVDPKLRAALHVLEDWADESLYFYEMRLRFTLAANARENMAKMYANDRPLAQRFLKRVLPGGIRSILDRQGIGRKSDERVLADVERHVQAIEDWLGGGDWLLGNGLTLADLSVCAMLYCFEDAAEARAIICNHEAVNDWMRRVEDITSQSHQMESVMAR